MVNSPSSYNHQGAGSSARRGRICDSFTIITLALLVWTAVGPRPGELRGAARLAAGRRRANHARGSWVMVGHDVSGHDGEMVMDLPSAKHARALLAAFCLHLPVKRAPTRRAQRQEPRKAQVRG